VKLRFLRLNDFRTELGRNSRVNRIEYFENLGFNLERIRLLLKTKKEVYFFVDQSHQVFICQQERPLIVNHIQRVQDVEHCSHPLLQR
jgi:hypothetical protein